MHRATNYMLSDAGNEQPVSSVPTQEESCCEPGDPIGTGALVTGIFCLPTRKDLRASTLTADDIWLPGSSVPLSKRVLSIVTVDGVTTSPISGDTLKDAESLIVDDAVTVSRGQSILMLGQTGGANGIVEVGSEDLTPELRPHTLIVVKGPAADAVGVHRAGRAGPSRHGPHALGRQGLRHDEPGTPPGRTRGLGEGG